MKKKAQPATVTATEALVLRRFDFSENSQVGHLFTRQLGRVSVLAKGIKRPGPELRGPMDLFSRAEISLRQRRGDMQLLVKYRVITGYMGLRQSLPNLHAAYYVTELLREGTRDLDPHPELFDATVETLETIESAKPEALAAVVLHYELGYLREAGFQPELSRCVRCGRVAPATGPVRFSPAQGGLICRGCVAKTPAHLTTVHVSARAVFDGVLAAGTSHDAASLKVSVADGEFMRGFMRGILERVLEKELKSTTFLPGGRPSPEPGQPRR